MDSVNKFFELKAQVKILKAQHSLFMDQCNLAKQQNPDIYAWCDSSAIGSIEQTLWQYYESLSQEDRSRIDNLGGRF